MDAMQMVGYDCVVIPGASKAMGSSDLGGSEFCGRQLASLMSAMPRATVCSKYFICTLTMSQFEVHLGTIWGPFGAHWRVHVSTWVHLSPFGPI